MLDRKTTSTPLNSKLRKHMIRLKKFCKMKLMIRVQKVEEKILPLQAKLYVDFFKNIT